jgi:hypothetical protein
MKFGSIALLLILTFSPVVVQAKASEIESRSLKSINEVARLLASELLEGLNQRPVEPTGLKKWAEDSLWVMKRFTKSNENKAENSKIRKVALWPFWKEGDRISGDFARSISDRVLAELVRSGNDNNKFIVREELNKLVQEIDDFNALQESSLKINKLMRRAGADAIIAAHVRVLDGNTIELAYKAVEVATGVILAQTKPYRLAYDFETGKSMDVETAINASVRFFREKVPDIKIIRPKGIYFQNSGIQTTFGRWFLNRFVGVFNSRSVSGGTVEVREVLLDEKRLGVRGLGISKRESYSIMSVMGRGDYVLTGEYWDFGKIVDIQVTFVSGDGTQKTWQEKVRRSSIPKQLKLTPDYNPKKEQTNDGVGPIGLFISSLHGRNPIYRIGQSFTLLVQVNHDSHLYCFYRQADGEIMKIFPNGLHTSPLIKAGSIRKIPDKKMGFNWRIKLPTGTELVKCYAFDRDVSDDLPRSIRLHDFVPLQYRSFDEITQTFRQFRNVGIAENSMVVNVERRQSY